MNLLLVDDHPLFSTGFAHALRLLRPAMCLRLASTVREGLAQAAAWPELDLVLIDYRLPGEDGLEGLRMFARQHPLVARVLLSGQESSSLIVRARLAGASGFLGKSLSMDNMLAVLDRVAQGDSGFEDVMVPVSLGVSPTVRQLEVLNLVAAGLQNKSIAHALGIAERTVKLHVTALLEQLGARNRTQLLVRAQERGLL